MECRSHLGPCRSQASPHRGGNPRPLEANRRPIALPFHDRASRLRSSAAVPKRPPRTRLRTSWPGRLIELECGQEVRPLAGHIRIEVSQIGIVADEIVMEIFPSARAETVLMGIVQVAPD